MRSSTAAAAVLLGVTTICAASSRPAQAQRPFRLLLGLSAPREHRIGAGSDYTDRGGAAALHLAYDLPRRQRIGSLPPLILSAYYDAASYADDSPGSSSLGFPSFDIQTTEAYNGFGAMLRAPYRWGYAGVGLGLYKGRVGGKVFAGLQGRGSLFLEASWTVLARPNYVGNPYPVLGVGVRL